MSSIRVASLNINSDRNLEWKDDPRFKHNAHAFADLSIKNRFPVIKTFILDLIKTKKVSCFALQEVDSEALKLLESLFKELNFKTHIAKYCPHKEAYHYILATNEDILKVKEVKQIYFTETGKPTSDEERDKLTKEQKLQKHLDQEFEKSAQLVRVSVQGEEKAEDFILVNLQAGTSNKHRILAMQKLSEELKQITLPLILTGDFNQFDGDKKEAALYFDQINILQKSGFNWCTEALQNKGVGATFNSFPHDIARFLTSEEQKELNELKKQDNYKAIREFYINTIEKRGIMLSSVCIDAVFAKVDGKLTLKTKPYTHLHGKTFNTSKVDRKEFQKLFLSFFKNSNAKSSDMPVSDHFALLTKIQFSDTEVKEESIDQRQEIKKTR